MLDIDRTLASSASAVFSHAHGDGHGGTLIDFGSGHTIDLAGVSLWQLKQHASDLHFVTATTSADQVQTPGAPGTLADQIHHEVATSLTHLQTHMSDLHLF